MQKGQNFNHPKPGDQIKVDPIRNIEDIQAIKSLLAAKPRDLCLFTLGINTAFRAGELLSIQVKQVKYLEPGETLSVWQTKTNKYRAVTINQIAAMAIENYLYISNLGDEAHLFSGQRGSLSVPYVNRLVKTWCAAIGLKGNYGSHTLRKTWGFHQCKAGANIVHLMQAFGHATQWQTLQYLGVQPGDIAALYDLNL